MDKISCVYMIVYKPTGQLYIGETIDYHKRMKQHTNYNTPYSKIDTFINTHNINDFHFFILEEVIPDKKLLRQKEQEYIENFDATSFFNFNIPYQQRMLSRFGISSS